MNGGRTAKTKKRQKRRRKKKRDGAPYKKPVKTRPVVLASSVWWLSSSSSMARLKWPHEYAMLTAVSSLSPVSTQICDKKTKRNETKKLVPTLGNVRR